MATQPPEASTNVLLTSATKTPDVPPLTAAAVVGAVAAVAAAFGFDLSEDARRAIEVLATAAIIALPLADSWLRGRRAMAVAHIEHARITAAATVTAAELAPAPAAPATSSPPTIVNVGSQQAAPIDVAGASAAPAPAPELEDPPEVELGPVDPDELVDPDGPEDDPDDPGAP